MYLTQFEINTKRRGSRHLLASPQRVHAAVLSCFPANALDEGRVLWRLDHGSHDRRELWISSPSKPDLSALVEDCGWPTAEGWRTESADGLFARLAVGQRWRFRLSGNPVTSLPADGRRGKVIPLTQGGYLDWLAVKGDTSGFSVSDGDARTAVVSRDERLQFTKESGRRVSLARAQFDGVLEVTDAVRLRGAMVQGIGRAKAYGCGLLTLARS